LALPFSFQDIPQACKYLTTIPHHPPYQHSALRYTVAFNMCYIFLLKMYKHAGTCKVASRKIASFTCEMLLNLFEVIRCVDGYST
jgi:hypothetical protein